MLIFEIKGIGWHLYLKRISYKLTKRATENEKNEKFLKMFNLRNFKIIRYKLTASGNNIHSI